MTNEADADDDDGATDVDGADEYNDGNDDVDDDVADD